MRVGIVAKGEYDTAIDLANALNELGVVVSLFLPDAIVAKKVGLSNQMVERLYELGRLPAACKVRLFRLLRMRNPFSFRVIRKLRRTMRDDGIDVAHILCDPDEPWLALLACVSRDIPVTSTMIIPEPHVGDHLPTFLLRAINKLLTYGSNMVIVNGSKDVDIVSKLYRVPKTRVVHIPLSPRTTAVKWSDRKFSEEPGTVLFFGRAHPHKGLEYLIRAQPLLNDQVPHARILIAARGQEMERCRGMIQDASKFEIHEGFIPDVVVPSFFQRASLVAIPYISASTSAVLLMAYGFGKPVVATNVGSLPDYVEDGVTGLLVPPRDAEKLAEAMVSILSDNNLRHRMGENAKRFENRVSRELAINTVRVYEKAISLHNNAHGGSQTGNS